MKKQLTKLALVLSLSTVIWSCKQKDPVVKGDFVQGVFVINEGNFSQNNGAISYFKREQTTSQADAFADVNGAALGGGVQGYAVAGATGVILVDNSAAGMDKVEIVDANSFKSLGSIGTPDIENPRDVVLLNSSKAYVSCWGTNSDFMYQTGYIAVVDLMTNKVTKKITIPSGPETLVLKDGKLFVGTISYAGGNNLTVISTTTDEIVKTITFNATPTPIGIDANGKLWIGAGIQAARMDPATFTTEATLTIGSDASQSAANFAFSSDLKTIFFVLSSFDSNFDVHGGTYKFGIGDTQVNVTTPFIGRVFTGLSVDPMQGLIYAGVTPSYAQSGYAVRYRTDGSLVDSVKVAVAPTGFLFR